MRCRERDPGARREMMESYVRRLEDLERIANSFKGVEKSYAVQEVERFASWSSMTSSRTMKPRAWLAEIARKIENEMTYPGQIKVTVIREMRSVDYAK